MKQPVCSVYDKKTKLYDNLFACRHVGEAAREFETLLKDPKTKFGKNPEDFMLYQIGNFNYETAEIEHLKEPMFLIGGPQV